MAEPSLDAFLKPLLSSPQFRSFVAAIAVETIAGVIHHRTVDPSYLAQSDQVFKALAEAKTEVERDEASQRLLALMAL